MQRLKYNYKEGETPAERLRNKIQPLYTLVSYVEVDEGASPQLKSIGEDCSKVLEDINTLLDDVEVLATVPARMIEFKQNNTLGDANNL